MLGKDDSKSQKRMEAQIRKMQEDTEELKNRQR